MTTPLENLPMELTLQFHKLRDDCRDKNVKAEASKIYVIDGLATTVLVNIARTSYDYSEVVASGRGKPSDDTVTVTIDPPNEQIEQVVASHFKGKIIPAYSGYPQVSLFNSITINDKKIV